MLVKFGRISMLNHRRTSTRSVRVGLPQMQLRFFFSLRNLSHEALFSYMLYTPKRRSFWSFRLPAGWYV